MRVWVRPHPSRQARTSRPGAIWLAGPFAGLNVIDFAPGYAPESGAWGPDTVTPTREGDERVTLRLAVIGEGGGAGATACRHGLRGRLRDGLRSGS